MRIWLFILLFNFFGVFFAICESQVACLREIPKSILFYLNQKILFEKIDFWNFGISVPFGGRISASSNEKIKTISEELML